MKKFLVPTLLSFTLFNCNLGNENVLPQGDLPTEFPVFYVLQGQTVFIDHFYFTDKSSGVNRNVLLNRSFEIISSFSDNGQNGYFSFDFKEGFKGDVNFDMRINRRLNTDKFAVKVVSEEDFPCDGGPINDFVLAKGGESVLIDVLKNDKFCNMKVNSIELIKGNVNDFVVENNKIRFASPANFEGSEGVLYRISVTKNEKTFFYLTYLQVKVSNKKAACKFNLNDDFVYYAANSSNSSTSTLSNYSFLENDEYCQEVSQRNFKVVDKLTDITFSNGFLDKFKIPSLYMWATNILGDRVGEFKYEVCSGGECRQAKVRFKIKYATPGCVSFTLPDEYEAKSDGTFRCFPIENDELCSAPINFSVKNISSPNVEVFVAKNSGELVVTPKNGFKGDVTVDYGFDGFQNGIKTPMGSTVKIKIK